MPEVNDLIIDYASDDKATLTTCTLISKDFYHRSALHLFTTITIININTLLDFQHGAESSFCKRYVKQLTLGAPKLCRHRPHCGCPPPLHIDGRILFDLIAALPSLRPENVTFEDVLWKPVFLHRQPSVGAAADSSNQLYVISPAAPHKRILDVDSVLLAVAPLASEVGKKATGVRILEVKTVPLLTGTTSRSEGGKVDTATDAAVYAVIHVGDLKSLDVPSVSGASCVVDGLIIRWKTDVDLSLFDGMSPCLRRPGIPLKNAAADAECGRKLALSSYTQLHSVSLWVSIHHRAPPAWQQWQAYLALLLQVPGDQVFKILVGVILDADDLDFNIATQINTTRWGMLSNVLQHFTSLRRVEITVIAKDEMVRSQVWLDVYSGLRGEVGGPGGVRVVSGSPVVV